MIFLWVFGDDVEEALGRVRFLIFYLACGALGGLTFVASDIYSDSALIGASGAIAGVVVAYVMLRPCAQVTVLVTIIPVRLSAYWVVGAFALLQIINLDSASRSEVAYWCHVGGMVAGALLLLVLRPAGVRLFDCMRPERLPDGPSVPVSDASMPNASRLPHRRH
jgi:membrane associated rhomboid family serine protease